MAKSVEKYFSKMPKSKALPNSVKVWKPDESLDYFVKTHPEVNQVHFGMQYFAPKLLDEQSFPLLHLATILGGDATSRLFSKIRIQKGYAYSVGADYGRDVESGMFSIYAKTSEKNLASAVKLVKQEIESIKTKAVSDIELTSSKNKIKASEAFAFEPPLKRAKIFNRLALSGIYPQYTPSSLTQRYMDVTKDEILKASDELFSRPVKISVFSKTLSVEQVKDLI